MKGLLQNKRFKKNLKKWLVMYIGVIALLTTIITYSKYVTSMTASDSARVAKFKVNITPIDCTMNDENICDFGNARPTSDLNYSFNVDTTNLEVKTQFVLTIYINSNFTGKITSTKHPEATYTKKGTVKLETNYYDMYEISEQIAAGKGYIDTYNVAINYNIENGIDKNQKYDIVRVDYSAVQIK